MEFLLNILLIVLEVLFWLIIIDAILSFFPSIPRNHPLVALLRSITGPVVEPFRRIIPPQRVGDSYVDFAPLLAILVLMLLQAIIRGLV